jgi:hypothetical protein
MSGSKDKYFHRKADIYAYYLFPINNYASSFDVDLYKRIEIYNLAFNANDKFGKKIAVDHIKLLFTVLKKKERKACPICSF